MKNKKIVFHVTRQYMKQNKKRTITTAIGIMFMVMMMTCVFVGKDTAISYLTQVAESKSGSWHMAVYGLNKEQYDKISTLDFVDKAALSCDLGFTEFSETVKPVDKKESEKLTSDKNESENLSVDKNEKEPSGETKPYLEIKGYSSDCFDWMNIRISEGRYPEKENEIIVSRNAIDDGTGLKLGDTIHTDMFYRKIKGINSEAEQIYFPYQGIILKYGEIIDAPQDFPYFGENDSFEEMHVHTGRTEEYEIVGFMETPYYETEPGSFYAALTWIPNDASIFAEVKNNYNLYSKKTVMNGEQVNLSLKFNLKKYDNTKFTEVEEIMGLDPYAYDPNILDTNDLVLTFSGDSSESATDMISLWLVTFFVIFILLVSVILIYNVFNISFEERRRYLGMLASVGATRKQKSSSVYYEAFILLFFALPVGFLLGIAVVKAGMLILQPYIFKMMDSFVAEVVNNTTVKLVITPVNVILVIAASVLTVLISSLLPAMKIGKIGPIESIRGIDKAKDRKWKSSPHLMKKGRTEKLLALRNIFRQRQKTGSIIRAVAVFLIVLMVTTFGTSAVTQMVQYRLVDDVTVATDLKGYDYVLSEREGYGRTYANLKNEIIKDLDVADTKEWYMGMFASSIDGRILNENYWNAMFEIIRENYGSDLTDEECMKAFGYDIGERDIYDVINKIEDNDKDADEKIYETLSIIGVDNETFSNIADKCGCNPELIKNSECPAILYRDIQLTTDNMRFEDRKPAHYRVFELDSICDLEPGSTFNTEIYSAKEERVKNFPYTLVGYADREDIEEYLTFNGEHIWIIINEDTARRVNQMCAAEDDIDSDGNYNTLERELYIKLSNPDGALANKLKYLSTQESEEYSISGGDTGGYNLENVAEALNYAIRILAVGFVIFSGLICLLNLYNSIRGRAIARKHDIAMLRSIGMEDRQIDKMLFLENMVMWFAGLIWSVVISLPITYGIDIFLIRYFGVMKLKFPWYLYMLAAFITIISLLLMSKVCYHMKEDEILIEEMRENQ